MRDFVDVHADPGVQYHAKELDCVSGGLCRCHQSSLTAEQLGQRFIEAILQISSQLARRNSTSPELFLDSAELPARSVKVVVASAGLSAAAMEHIQHRRVSLPRRRTVAMA